MLIIPGNCSVHFLQTGSFSYMTAVWPSNSGSWPFTWYQLFLRPSPTFASCPNNAVCSERIELRTTCCTCHVSLFSFNLEQFLNLSLTFMTLTVLKSTGQFFFFFFGWMSTEVFLLMFPHDLPQLIHIWQDSRSDAQLFSLHPTSSCVVWTGLITEGEALNTWLR